MRLTYDEKERLAYQQGNTELATLYAIAADAESADAETTYTAEEYDTLEREKDAQIELLREQIKAAEDKLDDLYDHIADAERLHKKTLLAALTDIELDWMKGAHHV